MREPPIGVEDAEVQAVVRREWLDALAPPGGIEHVEHLPIGFGAHHWQVARSGVALFVTLEAVGPGRHHTAASLERTYAAASSLTFALDFAVASLPSAGGRLTVPFGATGALSATLWVHGQVAGGGPFDDRAAAEETAAMLTRLHRCAPPPGVLPWASAVPPDLADDLERRLLGRWASGPHGEVARTAIREHRSDIAIWCAEHRRLAEAARDRDRVPTHGEPHTRNQMLTYDGHRLLIDWESLRLAPRERDLIGLATEGYADLCGDPDREMLALFDLEQRLDEIAQYSTRFEEAHTGTDSDRVALDGLLHELERP